MSMSDELKEAAKLIQGECYSHNDCKECAFYEEGYGCAVDTNPYAWGKDYGEE